MVRTRIHSRRRCRREGPTEAVIPLWLCSIDLVEVGDGDANHPYLPALADRLVAMIDEDVDPWSEEESRPQETKHPLGRAPWLIDSNILMGGTGE